MSTIDGYADALLAVVRAEGDTGADDRNLGAVSTRGHRAQSGRVGQVVVVGDDLGANESFLEISMDDTSSLRCRDPFHHLDPTTPGQIARSVVTSD